MTPDPLWNQLNHSTFFKEGSISGSFVVCIFNPPSLPSKLHSRAFKQMNASSPHFPQRAPLPHQIALSGITVMWSLTTGNQPIFHPPAPFWPPPSTPVPGERETVWEVGVADFWNWQFCRQIGEGRQVRHIPGCLFDIWGFCLLLIYFLFKYLK